MKSCDQVLSHLALPSNRGTMQYSGRWLIWAPVWKNGWAELHILKNNMNSEGFVLKRHILPLSQNLGDPTPYRFWWKTMSSSCMPQKLGLQFLQKSLEHLKSTYSGLLACSPNFNFIENVWTLEPLEALWGSHFDLEMTSSDLRVWSFCVKPDRIWNRQPSIIWSTACLHLAFTRASH